jgi:hypothetical protein
VPAREVGNELAPKRQVERDIDHAVFGGAQVGAAFLCRRRAAGGAEALCQCALLGGAGLSFVEARSIDTPEVVN